jgi:hypothetical protein
MRKSLMLSINVIIYIQTHIIQNLSVILHIHVYSMLYIHVCTYICMCVCVYIIFLVGWIFKCGAYGGSTVLVFMNTPAQLLFLAHSNYYLCVCMCVCVCFFSFPLFFVFWLVGWFFETGITLHPRLASHLWSSCPSAGIIDKSHHPQLSPSFLTTSHKLCLCFWQWVFTCCKWCKYFVQDCHLHFRVVHFFFFLQHQYFGFSNVTFDNPLFWIFSHS